MDQNELLALRGKIEALEVIYQCSIAHMTQYNKQLRTEIITGIEQASLATNRNAPLETSRVIFENFQSTLDEVADKIRNAP